MFTINNEKNISNVRIVFNNSIYADYEMREPIDDVGVDSNVIYICYKDPIGTDSGTPMSMHGFYEVKEDSANTFEISNNGYRVTAISRSTGSRVEYDMQTFVTRLVAEIDPYITDFTKITEDQAKAYAGDSDVFWIGNLTDGSPFMFKATTIYEVQLAAPRFGEPHAFMYDPRTKKFKSVLNNIKFKEVRFPITNLTDSAYDDNDTLYIMSPSSVSSHGQAIYFNPTRKTIYEMKENGILGTQLNSYDDKYFTWSWDVIESLAMSLYNSRSEQTEIEIGGFSSSSYDYGTKLSFSKGDKGFHVGNIVVQQLSNQSICDPVFFIPAYDLYGDYTYRSDGCPSAFLYKRINGQFKLVGPSIMDTPELSMAYNYPEEVLLRKYRYVTKGSYSITDNSSWPPVETLVKLGRVVGFGFNEAALMFTGAKYDNGDFIYEVYGTQYHISEETLLDKIIKGKELISGGRRHRCVITQDCDAWARSKDVILYLDTNDYSLHLDYVRDMPENTIELYSRNNLLDTYDKITSKAIIDVEDIEDVADPREDCFYREYKEAEPTDNYIRTGRVNPDTPEMGYYSIYGYDPSAGEQVYPVTWMEKIDDRNVRMFIQSRPQFGDQVYYWDTTIEVISSVLMGMYEGSPVTKWVGLTGAESPANVFLSTVAGTKILKAVHTGDTKDPNRTSFYIIYDKLADEFKFNILSKDNRDAFDPYEEYPLDEGTEKKPVIYHRFNDEWYEVGEAVVDTEDIDKEDSSREGVIFREDNSLFKTKGEVRGTTLGYISAYINEDDTYCGLFEGGRYEFTYLEHGTTYTLVDLGYWNEVYPILTGADGVINTTKGDVKIVHTGDTRDAHAIGRLVYNTYRDDLEVEFFEDFDHSVKIPDPNIGYYNFVDDNPEKLNSAIVDVKGLNDVRDPRPDMLYRVKPNYYAPIPESEGAYVAIEKTGGMGGAAYGTDMDFTRTDRETITVTFKYKNAEETLTITDADIADKQTQLWAMKRISFFGSSECYIDISLREYNEVTEWNESKRSTIIARRRDKNTQVVPTDHVYLFDSKKDVEDNVTYGIPGIYHYEEDQWKKVGSSIIAYDGSLSNLTSIDEDAIYRVHNYDDMSENGLYYRFDGEWQKFSRGVVDVRDTIATEFTQEDNIIFRDKNYLNNYKYDGEWNGVKLGYFSIRLRDYPSGEVIVDNASGRMSIWMEGFNGVLTSYEDYEEITDLPQLLRNGSTEIIIPTHGPDHMYSGQVVGIIEYTGNEFKYETAGRVWFDGNNIQMTSFKGRPEKYDKLPSTTNWYNLVDGKFEKINGSIIDVDTLDDVQSPREDYIYRVNPAQLTCEDDESYILLFNESYEFYKSHIWFEFTKPWDPAAEILWIQYRILHTASEFEISKADIANSNSELYHHPYREIYGPAGTFAIGLGRTKTPENFDAIVIGKINDNDDISTLVFFDNDKEGAKAKNRNAVSGLWHYHNDQWNKLGGGKINVVDKLDDVDLDDHDNFTFIPGGSSDNEFITDIGHRFIYNGKEYVCGYTSIAQMWNQEYASAMYEIWNNDTLIFKDSMLPAEYSYIYWDEDITDDKLEDMWPYIDYHANSSLLVYYDDKWYNQQPDAYKQRQFTLRLDVNGGNYNSTSMFYIYTDKNNKLYVERIHDGSEFHPKGETPPSGELLVHAADGQLHIVSSGSSSGTAFTIVQRMQDMVDTSKVYALEYKKDENAALRNYKFFAWVKGLWDEYGWNQISCSGIAPWDEDSAPTGDPDDSYHATDRFYYDRFNDAIYAPCGNHWITIKGDSGHIVDTENIAEITDTNRFYRYKQNTNGDIQAFKFIFSPCPNPGPEGYKFIGPIGNRSRLEYLDEANIYLQIFDTEGTSNQGYAEYRPEPSASEITHYWGMVTSGVEDDILMERLGTDKAFVRVTPTPCDLNESDFVWWTKEDGTVWKGPTKQFLPLYEQDVKYIESIMYAPLNDRPRAVGGPIEITKELYDTIIHVKDQIYLIDIED